MESPSSLEQHESSDSAQSESQTPDDRDSRPASLEAEHSLPHCDTGSRLTSPRSTSQMCPHADSSRLSSIMLRYR